MLIKSDLFKNICQFTIKNPPQKSGGLFHTSIYTHYINLKNKLIYVRVNTY